MKKILLVSTILILFLQNILAQNKTQQVFNSDKILIEGRYIQDNNTYKFCYPGTAFTIKFVGTYCSVSLKSQAGYFVKSIDGGAYQKFNTYEDTLNPKCEIILAENLKNEEHTVKIILISEGLYCGPEFYGFNIDEKAKVLKPEHKKIKIEFIGNSITCGYGVEANSKEDHFADSTSNFTKSFAGITCKNLDAETMIVARSGIGIYRNFADKTEGSDWPMPRVYENTLINDSVTTWTFDNFKPNVLVVCLGTNDLSTKGYDKEKFLVSYVEFIKKLRKHYPVAKIVLCNSPMLHYEDAQVLSDAIYNTLNTMYTGGDTRLFKFDFQEDDGSLGYGADWHPSAKRQSDNARYLTYYIETEVLKTKKKE
ncbi:MAG: GDSL-type esterase/lipase family protein [Bacteroidales bacterium]|nr:GDSL-type esterase/lipase family protein [Bacteroidales bacterium]